MSATVDYSDTAKRGKVKIECIALAGRYVRNSYLNAKVNLTLDSSAPVLLGLFMSNCGQNVPKVVKFVSQFLFIGYYIW